ncbi:MAG: metal-sensitive transcriptional regulator [Chloroflexi bacterium]|nr:metal-sensitive transcriptional regulator [Chloroflexota bacterium]
MEVKEYPYTAERENLLGRMKKIEGQARGIHNMLLENRYCVDILQQLNALSAAAEEVALILLDGHIRGCVADAINNQEGDAKVKELMDIIRKYMKR